jgi:hypothetical protein
MSGELFPLLMKNAATWILIQSHAWCCALAVTRAVQMEALCDDFIPREKARKKFKSQKFHGCDIIGA